MADNTTRLELPYLAPAQAQKHVTVNEALRRLDSLIMLCLESRQISAQPGSPSEGHAYLLPGSRTGSAWSQFAAGSIAVFEDNAWRAFAPKAGFTAYLRDEAQPLVFDGTQWRPISATAIQELQALRALGIGTQADASNPFAAKLNKALWTALYAQENGSGDLRFTFNKENTSRVLSLLFQSNYAARAEIGLIGNDELVFRASSDGVNFVDIAQLRTAQRALQTPNLLTGSLNGGPIGGLRNRLINGAFLINQRQNPGGAVSAGVFIADRWRAGAGGASVSVSNGLVTLNSGSIEQSIEPQNFGLAGRSIVVSVDGSSANAIGVILSAYGGGAGSFSGTIPAGSGRRGIVFEVPGTVTAGALLSLTASGGAVSCSDIVLTQGNVVDKFCEWRPIGLELSLCERYFEKSYNMNGSPGLFPSASGAHRFSWSVNTGQGPRVFYKTRKRITPTVTLYSPLTGTPGNVSSDTVDYAASIVTTNETGFSLTSTAATTHSSMLLHYTADAEY